MGYSVVLDSGKYIVKDEDNSIVGGNIAKVGDKVYFVGRDGAVYDLDGNKVSEPFDNIYWGKNGYFVGVRDASDEFPMGSKDFEMGFGHFVKFAYYQIKDGKAIKVSQDFYLIDEPANSWEDKMDAFCDWTAKKEWTNDGLDYYSPEFINAFGGYSEYYIGVSKDNKFAIFHISGERITGWVDQVSSEGLVEGKSDKYVIRMENREAIFDKNGNQITPFEDREGNAFRSIYPYGLLRDESDCFIANTDKGMAIFDKEGNRISEFCEFISPEGVVRGQSDYYIGYVKDPDSYGGGLGYRLGYKDRGFISSVFKEIYTEGLITGEANSFLASYNGKDWAVFTVEEDIYGKPVVTNISEFRIPIYDKDGRLIPVLETLKYYEAEYDLIRKGRLDVNRWIKESLKDQLSAEEKQRDIMIALINEKFKELPSSLFNIANKDGYFDRVLFETNKIDIKVTPIDLPNGSYINRRDVSLSLSVFLERRDRRGEDGFEIIVGEGERVNVEIAFTEIDSNLDEFNYLDYDIKVGSMDEELKQNLEQMLLKNDMEWIRSVIDKAYAELLQVKEEMYNEIDNEQRDKLKGFKMNPRVVKR